MKTVEVVIEFYKLGEIDTLNEKYHAELYIEAKWVEPDTVLEKYDPDIHWNPKLYIENAIEEKYIETKYEIKNDSSNSCVITEIRHVKGVFWERLELQNFPVDVQELSVTLTTKLDPNELKLVADPQRTCNIHSDASYTFSDQQKWKLFKLVKVSEKASYENHADVRPKKPKIVVSIFCARYPAYYYSNAFFLIFLITVSSLTIFSVDCKLPQSRLQTTYTLLLTSVSFKWVINRSLPTVSYLTSLDKYAIICIFYVCLLCVWHSLVGSFWPKEQADQLDEWVLIAFSAIFVLINMAFLFWLYLAHTKIRKLKREESEFLARLYPTLYHQKKSFFFRNKETKLEKI